MKDRVKEYKKRRYFRILSRMDADSDDDEGRWITTENGHKVHLNEEGEPDKGNPHVLEVMDGKRPRVGVSEACKRIQALFGRGHESIEEAAKAFDELPEGAMVIVKGNEYTKTYVYTKRRTGFAAPHFGFTDTKEIASRIENRQEEPEFDVIMPEDIADRGGRTTDQIRNEIWAKRHLHWRNEDEFEDKKWGYLKDCLSRSPEGTRIEFDGESGRWMKKKKGDSIVWVNQKEHKTMDDSEMVEKFRESGFLRDGYSNGGVKYKEPKVDPFGKDSLTKGFHTFSDKKSIDSFRTGMKFAGTGSRTVAFFQDYSNSDELISHMSYDQRLSFIAWTRGAFMSGSKDAGWSSMSSLEKERVRHMDEILDQATLDEDIVVCRRSNAALLLGKDAKQPLLSELRAMKGKRVISRGAMSCAASSEGLEIGSDLKPVEYRIAVPKGTGHGMWLGDHRINGWGAQQREFVLNRDMEYEVGDTVYDPDRDLFVVELRLARKLEHDYGKQD